MSVDVITFGCRLNRFESEVVRGQALSAGLEDAVIVNTCAVTGEAVRQARQAVRRARRERPRARLIVTGCAAQIDPAAFASMPEVDNVLGNLEKLEVPSFARAEDAAVQVNDIMAVDEVAGHLVDGFDGRARAFVQVQQGCDHRCTFCIIPFARGNSRSVPIGAIVEQVRRLVANGYAEVVLTGVDITSYGADLPGTPSLGQMMRRLLRHVPELRRLRLSSVDPVEIDDEVIRLFAEEHRLMPHLHLSLQAGDDLILKRMKRRHGRNDAIELCAMLRRLRPEIVFGADLIAGFPTETEPMFANTLDIVEACELSYLHVFPYSERPGTPAARMPQVPKATRRERAARLRATGEVRLRRLLERSVGQRSRVLIEKSGLGRNEQFAEVILPPAVAPGAIVNVEQIGIADNRLIGRVAA